jgi:hypothetical protein
MLKEMIMFYILAKMISGGTGSSSSEELRLALCITKTTGLIRIQGATSSIDLNNKQAMTLNPAFPALRALPG